MAQSKKGTQSILMSLTTSLTLTLIFYLLALHTNSRTNIYTSADIAGGMIFVFILSMIVSVSIWPRIIK